MYWNSNAVFDGLQAIEKCRSQLLLELKGLLDDYFQWEKPIQYYDIIAGDWLEHFAHLTYASMVEGLLKDEFRPLSSPIPVAADLASHLLLRWKESGLHAHLREAVAWLLAGKSPIYWKFSTKSVEIVSGRSMSHATRLLRSITTSQPDVLLVDPYLKCGRFQTAATLIKWRRWAALDNLQYPIRLSIALNPKWRMHRAISKGRPHDLVGVLKILLPLHLPVALLEGFTAFRSAALAMPVKRPKIVYSANALHSHLTFKLLAAEWRDYGTRLLYHQHGGGYGVDSVHTPEQFESRVADGYFTWGWSNAENQKVKPVSPGVLKRSTEKRSYVMLSCCDFPKVVYRLHFHPMPGTIQKMHRETCEFLQGLPIRNNLLVRPYPHDFGWGFSDMMRKAAPDATFDSLDVSVFDRFAQSRLVVHNYLGTGYLETLALNIPTVCFYDAEIYAFRRDAQILMDGLEEVGILHRSGKAAARFVASLGVNPEGWWMKPEVQEARNRFITKYANFSSNWDKQWETEFRRAIEQGNEFAV